MAPPERSARPAADPKAEAAKADALFEAYFEESLTMNPIRATFIQDPRFHYLLPNFLSPTMRTAGLAFEKHWLHRITSEVDRSALEGQALLSYDVFVSQREDAIAGAKFPGELIPLTQFFSIPSFIAQLGSGQSAQPFQTVRDYEDWLVRLESAAVIFDQSIVNMRLGIAEGVTQPRIVMERVLPQLAAHVVEDIEKSVFWMPVKKLPDSFSAADKKRITTAYRNRIQHVVVPAYRRLHDFVKDEYLPKARDTVGRWALPNGREWYAYEVREMTTTDKPPEEIHEIGLAEVERIHDEMREVMKSVGFEGDLQAWFAHVQKDPKQYFATEEQALQGYRDLQQRVNALLPAMFDVAPKADYEVRAVEAYRAKSAAGASYMPASPDGSRPGVFYVNTSDLKRQPKYEMETLSLHEASPGHHFQISIQQEVETLPKFRRFGGYTAYAEGWALYAESIGKELGMFTDPMQYFGKLNAELFRAMRLVVDTGMHHHKWTREKAIDYMLQNSSMSREDVEPEVERYIAMPAQALAYKTGQLAIQEMRRRAEEALGDDFDIKAFHRAILIDGALPLDVLSAKIDAWIASLNAR